MITTSSFATPARLLVLALAALCLLLLVAPPSVAADDSINLRRFPRDVVPSPKFFAASSPAGSSVKFFATGTKQNDVIDTPTSSPNIGDTVTDGFNQVSELNVYTGIGAAFLIITGLVLVFWGHQMFKPILFIAGFYLFALIWFAVMQGIEVRTGNHFGGGGTRDLAYFISCIVAGVIGGLLFMCLWKLGLFAIGAMLGFVLGQFILSLIPPSSFSGVGRSIVLIVFTIVFGILILFLERPLMILGTAIPGAYAVLVGIDVFVKVGFNGVTRAMLRGSNDYVMTTNVWYMVGGFAALALIGIAFQFFHGRKHGHRASEERDRMLGPNKR